MRIARVGKNYKSLFRLSKRGLGAWEWECDILLIETAVCTRYTEQILYDTAVCGLSQGRETRYCRHFNQVHIVAVRSCPRREERSVLNLNSGTSNISFLLLRQPRCHR